MLTCGLCDEPSPRTIFAICRLPSARQRSRMPRPRCHSASGRGGSSATGALATLQAPSGGTPHDTTPAKPDCWRGPKSFDAYATVADAHDSVNAEAPRAVGWHTGTWVPDRRSVHTNPWHGHLPEQVRRADDVGRIVGELRMELGVSEGASEVLGGLPDSQVQEHAAAGYPSMELGGDVARLALEVGGVVSPRREKLLHVCCVDVELVDQDHRAALILELLGQRPASIHLRELNHVTALLSPCGRSWPAADGGSSWSRAAGSGREGRAWLP